MKTVRIIGWIVLSLLLLGGDAMDVRAQGRGKIAGTVTDSATGESLPGVNIVIVGTTLGTATDAAGDYFIANLEPGAYDVRASFVGYQTVTVQGVDVSANVTRQLDFVLESEALTLGTEVVVTAERPLVEQDNTTSIVRLETEEIAARPTANFTDVLTTMPSIHMENGEMRIRGGTLDEVAFVVDGARARNPLDHRPYTRFNLGAIQELEVITGSFNAEFGEAQSGVINIITKEGSERYEGYIDARYEPPGVRHWGTALYDPSSDLYWENTHARHLEWWIEYPDQWVDPNGVKGSDPRSIWTPEQAYQNYLDTHQPLTDYTETPTYQIEAGFGGPVPFLRGLTFFGTYKHRSEAPLLGNAFRDRGLFRDGTLKMAYRFGGGKKLTLSGFYGSKEAGWGFLSDDDYSISGYPFWADNYGIRGRYAYFDQAGYPYSQTDGQTLTFSHVLNAASLYEVKLTRVHAKRRVEPFPGDPLGFDASAPLEDNLQAVDENGNNIPGGNANYIGFNTSGYLFRYDDDNTDYELEAYYSSQVTKNWQFKTGLQFTYSVLDHFNRAKFSARVDSAVYRPYQGALYAQSKFEFLGFILNGGLRWDFYNPNDTVFVNPFNPFEGPKERTRLYSQLSPRLGVSHPIDTKTVLHFSYGHFFQRPSYGDYGETGYPAGNLTTVIVDDTQLPGTIGNRRLRPRKVTSFEVGLERNFWDFFVIDVTGYYRDIRNTIRGVTVVMEDGSTSYKTNGNGDYADFRGVELSIRKVPSSYAWGSIWGYTNYSTQLEIVGRSGSPDFIAPGQAPSASGSGDVIYYHNPYFKAGLYYETSGGGRGLLGLLNNVSVAFDYLAVFPHKQLRQDYFLFNGKKYYRDVNHETNLRVRKEIDLPGRMHVAPYVEVRNLFNDRWLNLSAFERASPEEQQKMIDSGFDYLPSMIAGQGVAPTPILDLAKFTNLPRSVLFGVNLVF